MRALCMVLMMVVLVSGYTRAQGVFDEAQWQAEAEQIAQRYALSLKPRLQRAISEGGFVHAIAVCAETAPAIAKQLSMESGWVLRRVSLKPRNKHSAVPDPFEREVLLEFDRRQANGEALSSLVVARVDETRFRYIKAQGVDALCLNCHGSAISEVLAKQIAQYYPEDLATAYELGQVRGAISLFKPL